MISIEIHAYHLRQKFEMEVDVEDGVQVIQDGILEAFNIPYDHQRLYFNGNPMESTDAICSYPFVESSVNEVILLVRPLGKLDHSEAFLEASIGDEVTEIPDVDAIYAHFLREGKLQPNDVARIIKDAAHLFSEENNLLYLDGSNITIVGDIHGQFFDLANIFAAGGTLGESVFLFMGDYVDRGPFGVETILYLYSLKIRYPNHVYLLRGNHETKHVTQAYGFKNECVSKYGAKAYKYFTASFNALPLAAVVKTMGGDLLCVHGGIGPDIRYLEQIETIQRFREPPSSGMHMQLGWCDPSPDETMTPGLESQQESFDLSLVKERNTDQEWVYESSMFFDDEDRGQGVYYFSHEACTSFCHNNNLLAIVRAHQVMEEGFCVHGFDVETDFPTCFTVFSAPNYTDNYKNNGAVLNIVDEHLTIDKYAWNPHPVYLGPTEKLYENEDFQMFLYWFKPKLRMHLMNEKLMDKYQQLFLQARTFVGYRLDLQENSELPRLLRDVESYEISWAENNEVAVGRSHFSDSKRYLPHYKQISSCHCMFHCRFGADGDKQVWVRDTSTNGTMVNGILLGKGMETRVFNGDQICLLWEVNVDTNDWEPIVTYVFKDLTHAVIPQRPGHDMEVVPVDGDKEITAAAEKRNARDRKKQLPVSVQSANSGGGGGGSVPGASFGGPSASKKTTTMKRNQKSKSKIVTERQDTEKNLEAPMSTGRNRSSTFVLDEMLYNGLQGRKAPPTAMFRNMSNSNIHIDQVMQVCEATTEDVASGYTRSLLNDFDDDYYDNLEIQESEGLTYRNLTHEQSLDDESEDEDEDNVEEERTKDDKRLEAAMLKRGSSQQHILILDDLVSNSSEEFLIAGESENVKSAEGAGFDFMSSSNDDAEEKREGIQLLKEEDEGEVHPEEVLEVYNKRADELYDTFLEETTADVIAADKENESIPATPVEEENEDDEDHDFKGALMAALMDMDDWSDEE